MPILPVNPPVATTPAFGVAPGTGGGNANFAPQAQGTQAMPVAGVAPRAGNLALAAGIGGINPRPTAVPTAIGQIAGPTA